MLTSAKILKFFVPNKFSLGGGEFQGQKSWKHDFEITGDPKFPPGGSTFWSGFEAPVGQRPLSGPKNRKITNKAQNRDFSIPIDR